MTEIDLCPQHAQIWTQHIPPGPTGTRRQRERSTVEAMVHALLGPDARLTHDDDGAPRVDGAPPISISHSQRLAVVAVARNGASIGVDAEEWRDALQRVARRFLRPDEMAHCADLLLAWTIKEAVYKAAAQPLLTAHDIAIAPGMLTASTPAAIYDIYTALCGPTRLTLAIRQG